MNDDNIIATDLRDKALLGSGSQTIDAGAGNDRIISYGDAGEPDPAQTDGATGRVNPAIEDGAADDVITGGEGGDVFEFRALLNAKQEVITQHTGEDGRVNWAGVAGENDSVHDHWVEGFGNDTITDFSKAECDQIIIRGHTVEIADISYGRDDGGAYSLITVISQQGNGGAGGANTATGAHDEDSLGTIKVYGDRVTESDIEVQVNGVVDGIDRLEMTDALYGRNAAGVSQKVFSNTDGDSYFGQLTSQKDVVYTGLGAQTVDGGGGRDIIIGYSDGGEPDPAQTDGANGRVNAPVAAELANDVYTGGQGADTFDIRLVIDAKPEIIAKHTREDGTVNWAGVAGENDNVHDHWVEGIGDDVITDYSNQDGDKIKISGHTVEIASITYGEDDGGDFSLISLRSQQGNGGAGGENTATGAHDEDPLGTLKVYGDRVTEDDISVKNNTKGIDQLDKIAAGEVDSRANNEAPEIVQIQYGADNPETIDLTFTGTDRGDKFYTGSGSQTVNGGEGNDRIISFGDAGEPDPAQTDGANGRINPALAAGAADDVLTGGDGADKFEFRALVNARLEVIRAHTRSDGSVNWNGVAGENDNVHDHWVEGFGEDVITDFSKEEGDQILVRGHTVELADITYGEDEGGTFSLLSIISQQGDGGAGGANTATGAHDEDSLGTIKVYGDRVTENDVDVDASGNVLGVDRLARADELAQYNGGVQEFGSRTDGETIVTSSDQVKTTDTVAVGEGAQTIDTGAGNDRIYLLSDGGEPDPAQTDGADGRVNPAIPEGTADDIVSGGQGADRFTFQLLIDAKPEIIAKHTRDDGTVNWAGVAGENDNVHDHWVEGIGNDVITDYSNQDNDKIIIRGHTVEVASITAGEDEGGEFSLISLRSQQGNGGAGGANTATGAHDEDLLGTIKVYGDVVTQDDLQVINDTRGIDRLDRIVETDNQAAPAEENTNNGNANDGNADAANPDESGPAENEDDNANPDAGNTGGQNAEAGSPQDEAADAGSPNEETGDANNDDPAADNPDEGTAPAQEASDPDNAPAEEENTNDNAPAQEENASPADDQVLIGDQADNTMQGGVGADFLLGLQGNDNLNGGAGNDALFGNEGNDVLTGEEGDDFLDGGQGDDNLQGGAGNDTLVARDGTDTVNGGEGEDTFVFATNIAGGNVEDFEEGSDMFDLSNNAYVNGFSDIFVRVVSDTEAEFGYRTDGCQFVHVNVNSDAPFTLDAADFVF